MSNKINKAQNKIRTALSFEHWKSVNIKNKLNCIKCNKVKPLKEFYRLPLSKQPFRHQSIYKYKSTCKPCERKRFKKEKEKRLNNPDKRISKLLSDIKYRANEKKLKFELTHKILLEKYDSQSGLCYYSGEKMSFKQNDLNVVSVDRVDSSKGYTLNNTVLTCWVYNNMKQGLSLSEFKDTIKLIYENYSS